MDYYIIIPAHNEEKFIATTLDSIVAQTLLPKKTLIVNDNSTDATDSIIDSYLVKYKWLQKIKRQSSDEHLPGSKVIKAFNAGLECLDDNFDFIVKLDADLTLPSNYFETIAAIFGENPETGIAGGFAYEQDEQKNWALNHPMNKDHVRGAFKAYTKSCFKKIGGLKNSIGWDTVDELLARYHSFKIYTDEQLIVKHLRPTGKSYSKKARFMQGEAMYKMRYGLFITFIASIKMAQKSDKKFSVFSDCIKGYFSAKKNHLTPMVSKEEGQFIRKLRWRGILNKFRTSKK